MFFDWGLIHSKIKVKFLLLAQFEKVVDFDCAQLTQQLEIGEFFLFYKHFFTTSQQNAVFGNKSVRKINLQGLNYPLYINSDGIAGTISGMGKVYSAMTLSIILQFAQKSEEFDFSECIIISLGCCGGVPNYSKIGETYIASHSIDFDYGYHFDSRDTTDAKMYQAFDDFECSLPSLFELDPDLRNKAIKATIKLNKPFTSSPCITLSSDNYWHGGTQNERAMQVINSHFTNQIVQADSQSEQNSDELAQLANFKIISQFEDHAYATVCKQFNMLDRFLVIRTVVNYTSHESVFADISVKQSDLQQFNSGMHSNFDVVRAIIEQGL